MHDASETSVVGTKTIHSYLSRPIYQKKPEKACELATFSVADKVYGRRAKART